MIKILKQYTHGQNSLRGAAGILMVTLLLSNILGVVRNYFLTHYIPISSLDIYYAAFRLPDLVFNLLILGAIASAFIPVFTGYLQQKDQAEAWHIANAVLTLAVSSLLVSLIILYFLMPEITHLIVPNFNAAERAETIRISRLMLFSPFFFGISYIFGGILNSFQRFVAYAIAPLIYNLAIILSVAIFAARLPAGDPRQLTFVALGVISGAIMHMLIQLPSIRHLGWRFRWVFDYRHQAVRRIGKLMIPRTIGLGANQLMLVVFTALASAFPGAVSYFNLANDIQTMPTVVFGTSFATAIFPSLSAAASAKDNVRFASYLTRTINMIVILLIPATIGLILLRVGLVQILLGFNLRHVIGTANTLAMFSLSLVASGLIPLFSRAFYARHNTRTPTIIAIITIIISIIIAIAIKPLSDVLINNGWRYSGFLFGASRLAFAFSIGAFLNALLLYLPLRRLYPEINERDIFVTIIKVIFASIIMGMVIYFASHITAGFMNVTETRVGMLGQVAIAACLGILVYGLIIWGLKIREVKQIWTRGNKS